jgi:hypothetical protein
MRRTEWAVLLIIVTTLVLGIVAACEQGLSPSEETPPPIAPADPVITIDKPAKTISITDPVSPSRHLVITVDDITQTQTYTYGEFTMVSGQGYLTAMAGRDVYEFSWEETGDTRHSERYYVNGEVLTLEIDGRPTDAQAQAFIDFHAANDTGLGSHPDVVAMAGLWERAAPGMTTLVQASHPGLLQSSKIGYDDPELGLGKWLKRVCTVAAVCASIACKFAPVTNPFCWVCGGISIGCAVASLVAE